MRKINVIVRSLYEDWSQWFLGSLPGAIGIRLRRAVYSTIFGRMGKNVTIGIGVRFYNPSHIYIGDNVWIADYCLLIAGKPDLAKAHVHYKKENGGRGQQGDIHLDKNTYLAPYVIVQGHGGVYIGEDCFVAAGTKIYSMSHHYRTFDSQVDPELICKGSSVSKRSEQSFIIGAIILEKFSGVLTDCLILSGAVLGEGTWLLHGSKLDAATPSYKIMAGNPAVVIKDRK